MTPEEIRKALDEHGCPADNGCNCATTCLCALVEEALEAILSEREECAKVAENVNPLATDDDPKSVFLLIEEIAAAIRARSE